MCGEFRCKCQLKTCDSQETAFSLMRSSGMAFDKKLNGVLGYVHVLHLNCICYWMLSRASPIFFFYLSIIKSTQSGTKERLLNGSSIDCIRN